MRNITLCFILFAIGLTQSIAQSYTNSDRVRINHFNEIGKITLSQVFEDEQASTFNLKDYLTHHKGVHRISIQSTSTASNEIVHTRFSGNFEQLKANNFELCQKHTTSLRPFFGLSAHSTESFDGIIIDNVVSDSPASMLGLAPGDIIYAFNGEEIQTFCDLSIQVAQCTIGQNVSVSYAKAGQSIDSSTMTIGGQVVTNTKFIICKESNITITQTPTKAPLLEIQMYVYPNPTTDLAHIKYSSNMEEAVALFIIDQTGNVVDSQKFDVFTGSIHAQFNFNQFTSGTYSVLITQGSRVTQERLVIIQ